MVSEDFLLRVTLEALRTPIPTRDVTLKVEHVDRVVRHTLHENSEALLAPSQRVLGCLSLGDVPCDFGKADQRAILAAYWIDNDMRPHARPILADAPALLFEAALGSCDFERTPRQPCVQVLLRVEQGEVLTDDFVCGVAFEALRSRVPRRDDAAG